MKKETGETLTSRDQSCRQFLGQVLLSEVLDHRTLLLVINGSNSAIQLTRLSLAEYETKRQDGSGAREVERSEQVWRTPEQCIDKTRWTKKGERG